MHQLTLSFRDRKLRVYQLKGQHLTAGRDSACDIVIDSLAIEPVHARFMIESDQVKVSPASQKARVLLKGAALQEHLLQHGDDLILGKYVLTYQQNKLASNQEKPEPGKKPVLHQGWLQFTSGPRVGRSVPIKKQLMRIGKSNDCIALISMREDGFYISHLDGPTQTRVAGTDLTDQSRKLENGDSIQLGETKMLFFTDHPE